MLSGYITTLIVKKKQAETRRFERRPFSSRDRGKYTGFYTESMKASRDKKINQLDGFNHDKV